MRIGDPKWDSAELVQLFASLECRERLVLVSDRHLMLRGLEVHCAAHFVLGHLVHQLSDLRQWVRIKLSKEIDCL